MMTIREGNSSDRLPALDGLRGVAALSVVGEHCGLVFPALWAAFQAGSWNAYHGSTWAAVLTLTPLKLGWAGGPAVCIFFVLSGLVLGLPYWRNPQSYRKYLIRRICRIYPIYLLAIVLSIALFSAFGGGIRADASSWVKQAWTEQATLKGICRALIFWPGNNLQLNGPLWTLIHEMRISVAFPFVLASLSVAPRLTFATVLALSMFAVGLPRVVHIESVDTLSLLDTLAQVWLFAAGGLLGKSLTTRPAISVHKKWGSFLLTLALMLLVLRFCIPVPEAVSYLTTRIGAILLVGLAAYGSLDSLTLPPTYRLGEISYPLYALHFPILMAFVHGAPFNNLALDVAAAILMSLIVAITARRCVELPGIRFGRFATVDRSAA